MLASTSASVSQFVTEVARLKAALPADVVDTLARYEAIGDYRHPDYETAVLQFYLRHVHRGWPIPDGLVRTAANVANSSTYASMWGPNEFTCTGTLSAWNRADRLGEIAVPTLVTVGRYDEVTIACTETLAQGIPDAELVIFEHSAHVSHLEERDRYMDVVAGFLRRTDTPNV